MEKQTVGERIRLFRMAVLCMSQKDFAAKLGIATSSLNRIENGSRRPDNTTYMAMAQRTVISMDWLFLGEGPMRRAHYEPDPVDWDVMIETIEGLCEWANDYAPTPQQASKLVKMLYDEYAKRPDVTKEQRRAKLKELLLLIKSS